VARKEYIPVKRTHENGEDMKSHNGGRRRGGPAAPRGKGKETRSPVRKEAPSPEGSSRLFLTRLLQGGAIWNGYVATTLRAGLPTLVQLEFERTAPGQGVVLYTRPVSGALLDALHSGGPLSRADLEQELELAIREAADEGDGAATVEK
jgi:hypothetical protein